MTKDEARELAWANYEYRDGCLYSTTYHDGFDAGVAYAEGQWVRCDDRLPEGIDEVIVTILAYYNNQPATTTAFYYSDKWRESDGEPLGVPVIAWRPLPEPYTGESK